MNILGLLAVSIPLLALFLYGSLGEIITEKSGHLNLGTPGIMCVGGAGGMLFDFLYAKAVGSSGGTNGILVVLIGILGSLIFGGLMGALYSFLCVNLKANQNVVGLSLTTFGIGIYTLISYVINDDPDISIPTLAYRDYMQFFPSSWATSSWGNLFFGHGVLTYLAIILALVALFVIKKTKVGLALRSVGENPAAADAIGVNVNGYKYTATIIGGAIAGLGGLLYIMEKSNGTAGIELDKFGWIAVALVISSIWNPGIAIGISLIFAICFNIPDFIKCGEVGKELLKTLPYAVTIIILVVVSVFRKRETQPPQSLGVSYFREDR